jgi:hypothetical protein
VKSSRRLMVQSAAAIRRGGRRPSAPDRFLNKVKMISERVAHCVVSQSVGELIRLRVGDDSPYVFTVRDFEP